MTVWRWGAQVPASSAFMPSITKGTVTWMAYKANVDGQPGTEAIPAPNNDIPQDRFAVSADHRSSDAPPYWFPQVWWETALPPGQPGGGNDAGVRIYSDNQLPVPAIDPTRGTRRFGGGKVTPVWQDPYRRAQTRRTVQKRHG